MKGDPTRAGDIAEVIEVPGTEPQMANLGARVVVLEVLAFDERHIQPLQPMVFTDLTTKMSEGYMDDACLKPIRDLDDPEEELTTEDVLTGVI